METLKVPDCTHESNTVLHSALINEYRLPEELSVDFEEEYELSESHYGQKLTAQTRRTNRKFEPEYSTIKKQLKESFLLRLLDLYEEMRLSNHALKQVNTSNFCPLELALTSDHFVVLKRMLRVEPSLVHL